MPRKPSAKAKERKPYEIGYAKPPVHTRFPKGRSGNPRGKEKGHKGLRAVVSAVFQEKVAVRTPRGIKKVTKLDALVQKLMNDALTGDGRAVVHIVRLAKEAGLTHEATVIEEAQDLSEQDHLIMARYMKPTRDHEPDT